MNKLYTVTIGISALNEERNILSLINDLLKQENEGFIIEKIIVISDGSNDETAKIVQSVDSNLVQTVKEKERKGLAYRQNQLANMTYSDVLVLLNADVRISDKQFIAKLAQPIINKSVDLSSANHQAIKPTTKFETLLYVSMKYKKHMFNSYKNGNNIYTCCGVGRAFSKRLYKNIKYIPEIGEDAYSYLYARINKFNYSYEKDAIIYYKLPDNYEDHKKQSIRFLHSKSVYEELFGTSFVRGTYKLPLGFILKSTISYALRYPVHMFVYLVLFGYLKLTSMRMKKNTDLWDIANSSKQKITI